MAPGAARFGLRLKRSWKHSGRALLCGRPTFSAPALEPEREKVPDRVQNRPAADV